MQNNRRRSLCRGWRVVHYHLYPRRRHLGCPRERVTSNNNLTNRRRRRKNLTLYIRVKSRTGGRDPAHYDDKGVVKTDAKAVRGCNDKDPDKHIVEKHFCGDGTR